MSVQQLASCERTILPAWPSAQSRASTSTRFAVGRKLSRPKRSIPIVLPRSISPRRYPRSSLSPLWPMMTRRRSTPSCAKIACCASPDRPAAQVCVEIGTPVAFWARAEARSHGLDHRRHAGGVRGALDDARLDAARADAAGDVADEQLGDRVDAVATEVPLRHPPDPGGDDHTD